MIKVIITIFIWIMVVSPKMFFFWKMSWQHHVSVSGPLLLFQSIFFCVHSILLRMITKCQVVVQLCNNNSHSKTCSITYSLLFSSFFYNFQKINNTLSKTCHILVSIFAWMKHKKMIHFCYMFGLVWTCAGISNNERLDQLLFLDGSKLSSANLWLIFFIWMINDVISFYSPFLSHSTLLLCMWSVENGRRDTLDHYPFSHPHGFFETRKQVYDLKISAAI